MPVELADYQKGYQNAIVEVHKQHNFRSRKVELITPKKIPTDTPSTSQTKVDTSKEVPQKQDANVKEPEKPQSSFNIENELSKVKILVPLLELVKKDVYRNQVVKALKIK